MGEKLGSLSVSIEGKTLPTSSYLMILRNSEFMRSGTLIIITAIWINFTV